MTDPEEFSDAFPDQIDHLTKTHEDADSTGHHHEHHEDLFLCGATDETVHSVRTGIQGTFGEPWQVVSVVYPIENVEKRNVKSSLEDEAEQVGPPQAASLLPWVSVQVGSLVLSHILHVFPLPELHVSDDHERRAGDEDELQCPQADVGDGEDVVIAHIGAARLSRVADEVLALVPPNPLSGHHEDHDPEDEHHGQPDPPEGRGVFIHPTEDVLQSRPIHPCYCCTGRGKLSDSPF